MKRFLLAFMVLLLGASPVFAQATTSLPMTVPGSGTGVNFDSAVISTPPYWPLVRCWDGTTKCTLNATDGGLNIHIAGGASVPTITSNALVFGAITTAMTGTTATSLIAAVTSQHIYVTSISCQNTSATATLVQVLDGASTVIGNLTAGATYGGDNRQGSQPLFVTTAGNALEAGNATTGASVTCNAAGYSSAN